MIFKDIDTYLAHKEEFLDTFIDTGSDHELFVASYIHGHFSVIAANITLANNRSLHLTINAFESALEQSIKIAIEKGELSGQDANDVRNMLTQLQEH